MLVLYYTLGATLLITGLLALAFPLAASWIMGTRCIFAGLELTLLVGLATAKIILLNKKSTKQNEIKDLQAKITKIKAVRTQLEKDGQVALITFTQNISIIQGVWMHVVNDATDIQKWLEEGANDAHLPNYMKILLDKGVKVYSKMGQYLWDYMDGVTVMVKTFKD